MSHPPSEVLHVDLHNEYLLDPTVHRVTQSRTRLKQLIADRDQDHPQEKEMQKGKVAARRGLTNSCEKRRSEKQRRKDIPI